MRDALEASRRAGAAVLAVVVATGLAACETTEVQTAAGAVFARIDGEFALEESTGGPSLGSIQTDLVDDLGHDETVASVWGRVDVVREGGGRLAVSAFRYDDSSSGRLGFGTGFGDIPGGAFVDSDLSFTNVKASATWDVWRNDWFGFAPGIALDVFDVDLRVSTVTPVAAFESVQVFSPVPMLFVRGDADLGAVAALAEVGWMSLDLPDADATYWDVDLSVRLQPTDRLEVFGGWRYLSVDGDGDTDGQLFDADLELEGFVVGGSYRFGGSDASGR